MACIDSAVVENVFSWVQIGRKAIIFHLVRTDPIISSLCVHIARIYVTRMIYVGSFGVKMDLNTWFTYRDAFYKSLVFQDSFCRTLARKIRNSLMPFAWVKLRLDLDLADNRKCRQWNPSVNISRKLFFIFQIGRYPLFWSTVFSNWLRRLNKMFSNLLQQ